LIDSFVAEAEALYQAKCEEFPGGLETAEEIERDVLLQVIDAKWRDHLSDMDHLRDGIHLRQVAQQDPLAAWQREGFGMFEHMLENVKYEFVRFITHVEAVPNEPASDTDAGLAGAVTNAETAAPGATALPKHGAPAKADQKLGRNDPCWCGSGRKFKQCHGRP
jgi:preprotein translocase subunit SecA